MTRTIKVSSRGQVVIPADVRRRFDIGRDSRLELEVEGDHIVLRPIHDEDWKGFRGFLEDGPSTTRELEKERRRERERDESRTPSDQ